MLRENNIMKSYNIITMFLIELILSLKDDITIVKGKLTLVDSHISFFSFASRYSPIDLKIYDKVEEAICWYLFKELKGGVLNSQSVSIYPKEVFRKYLTDMQNGENYDGTVASIKKQINDDERYSDSSDSSDEDDFVPEKNSKNLENIITTNNDADDTDTDYDVDDDNKEDKDTKDIKDGKDINMVNQEFKKYEFKKYEFINEVKTKEDKLVNFSDHAKVECVNEVKINDKKYKNDLNFVKDNTADDLKLDDCYENTPSGFSAMSGISYRSFCYIADNTPPTSSDSFSEEIFEDSEMQIDDDFEVYNANPLGKLSMPSNGYCMQPDGLDSVNLNNFSGARIYNVAIFPLENASPSVVGCQSVDNTGVLSNEALNRHNSSTGFLFNQNGIPIQKDNMNGTYQLNNYFNNYISSDNSISNQVYNPQSEYGYANSYFHTTQSFFSDSQHGNFNENTQQPNYNDNYSNMQNMSQSQCNQFSGSLGNTYSSHNIINHQMQFTNGNSNESYINGSMENTAYNFSNSEGANYYNNTVPDYPTSCVCSHSSLPAINNYVIRGMDLVRATKGIPDYEAYVVLRNQDIEEDRRRRE